MLEDAAWSKRAAYISLRIMCRRLNFSTQIDYDILTSVSLLPRLTHTLSPCSNSLSYEEFQECIVKLLHFILCRYMFIGIKWE